MYSSRCSYTKHKLFACRPSQNSNLKENLKNEPPNLNLLNNFKVSNQTKCYIQNCNEYFYHKKYLLIHLQKEHQMTCEWIYKEFSSIVEYENWFANEFDQNYIYLRLLCGQRSNVIYYICNKDNRNLENQRKQNLTRSTNLKGYLQNTDCPCRLKVIIENDFIRVEYFPFHNHSLEFSNTQNQQVKRTTTNFGHWSFTFIIIF